MSAQPLKSRFLDDMYRKTFPKMDFFGALFGTENVGMNSEVSVTIKRFHGEPARDFDTCEGRHKVNTSSYTRKKYNLKFLNECDTIDACQLYGLSPGQGLEENWDMKRKLQSKHIDTIGSLIVAARQAYEYQASQILQTGVATSLYGTSTPVDFSANPTHFPTVANFWDGGSADPFGDILSLSEIVAKDGKHHVDTMILGTDAYEKFLSTTQVQTQADNRRFERISFVDAKPSAPPSFTQMNEYGGNFVGRVHVGSFSLNMWTYNGFYTDNTGPSTQEVHFMDRNKVIVMSAGMMLGEENPLRKLYYGQVPAFRSIQDATFKDYGLTISVPNAIDFGKNDVGVTLDVGVDPQNKSVMNTWIKSAYLCVPVAIDTFGCMTVLP